MQCKYPLLRSQPNIHICVNEAGHDGLHYTYTADGKNIYYSNSKEVRHADV